MANLDGGMQASEKPAQEEKLKAAMLRERGAHDDVERRLPGPSLLATKLGSTFIIAPDVLEKARKLSPQQ